ncbi:MAG: DNA-processing protein DprA, partial [Ferruginibacter sp.]
MSNELLYQVALTQVPNIGAVHAKSLVNFYGKASDIFNAPKRQLESIEGIGTVRMQCIKSFKDFSSCEEELKFIDKYKISPLFLTDDAFPKRLLNCYDCPVLLYYRGNADLNCSRVISVVGTRNSSEYGKYICESFIEKLKDESILIISGLAFGIDTLAHKSALKYNLKTVGVLAHGLDRIYPSHNKLLAKQMTDNGGLLTEFKSKTNPDRENFPKRNRIVAGLCDGLIVVESGIKGGSLITAELSNGYNKDVFAIPGRVNDTKSEGCNFLVKNNKAILVTSADDILDFMNWKTKLPEVKKQRTLFIELTDEETKIVSLLQQKELVGIDELYLKSGLSSSSVASALLML